MQQERAGAICMKQVAPALDRAPLFTGGTPLIASDCFLREIKTPKAMPLWLVFFLSEEQFRKTSFSKYGESARCRLAGASVMSCMLIPFLEQAVPGLAAERICPV